MLFILPVLGPHMFKVGRVIGRGAFGRVMAVSKKDTKRTYAVKLLDKMRVLEKGSFKSVLNERVLLAGLRCPHLVNLRLAYQTDTDLCMLVDLMHGGDVRFHLSRETFFDEQRVRFYAASIVLGLEYLHAAPRRILHRDIKPDNLLLDEHGYCHLTDFNVSVQLTDAKPLATGFAGTKVYIAPELWRREAYGLEPDLWSLGVTLYELLVGRVPFHVEPFVADADSALLKKMILEDKPRFPRRLSRDCMSFLYQLLDKQPQRRLKLAQVRAHAWFKGTDWERIADKSAKPPFEPSRTKANVAGIHDLEEQLGAKRKPRPLTDDERVMFAQWDWQREGAFDDDPVPPSPPPPSASSSGSLSASGAKGPLLSSSAGKVSSSNSSPMRGRPGSQTLGAARDDVPAELVVDDDMVPAAPIAIPPATHPEQRHVRDSAPGTPAGTPAGTGTGSPKLADSPTADSPNARALFKP